MSSEIHFQPPSKKIIILIGLIIAFFIGFFGYKPFIQAYRNGNFSGSLSYSTNGTSNNALDSDHDGLPDWQEVIWKTDIHNPDTDGDGTSDGEEVAIGRDPTKPGPNDVIDSLVQAIAITNSAQFLNDQNNLTQQLAQQIFTKSISTGNTSELDADSQAEIVSSLSGLQGQPISSRYSLNDIKLISGAEATNKLTLKNFGTSIVTIQDPLFNLSETSTDSDILRLYGDIVAGLAGLKVPESMATPYLNLLNNFYKMQQLYTRITTEYGDPVKAYVDTKSFQEITAKNEAIYKQFATYFRSNGIIWSKNESGDVWNSY